jgi:hypothetical protein
VLLQLPKIVFHGHVERGSITREMSKKPQNPQGFETIGSARSMLLQFSIISGLVCIGGLVMQRHDNKLQITRDGARSEL